MAAHPIKVFYSWHSDLPNSTNRGFIEDCLRRAAREVKTSPGQASIPIEFSTVIDRDVQDRLGASDIAATIFEKIAAADIFVADVTLIGVVQAHVRPLDRLRQLFGLFDKVRPTSNPNVLSEAGYAAGKLGWDRVICVCNEYFGRVEDLPFDIRGRLTIAYSLAPGQPKAEVRKVLTPKLTAMLTPLFHSAWQVHRPHPMRFAAYQDAALAANRFYPWLSALFRSSRVDPPSADWSTVLDPQEFKLTLDWARTDLEVEFMGGVRLQLPHRLAEEAEDFARAAEKLLSRYGERLDPLLYESLYRLGDSLLMRTLIGFSDSEVADAQLGHPRPRVFSAYVLAAERDLRALQTFIEWCNAEWHELAAYDPDLRRIEPVGSGAAGVWRIADDERERQFARWHASNAAASKPR